MAERPEVGERRAEVTPESRPYRILVPLDRVGWRPGLVTLARLLAEATGGEVHALHVVRPGERGTWSLPAAEQRQLDEVPHTLVTEDADSVAQGIVSYARRMGADLILLDWRGRPRALRNQLGHVLDPVIEDAPCKVALLKGRFYEGRGEGALAEQPPRYLLASSGGPNAAAALDMLLPLLALTQGELTLLRVVPEKAEEEEEATGRAALERLITSRELDEESAARINARVVRAANVEAAIVAAAKNHDLVFIGATNESIFTQLRIGSKAERMAEAIEQPVLVVKQGRSATQQLANRLWRRLDSTIPDVEIEDRLDTYKRVRRGARATVDFYFLMLCSVIIATMGLLIDSGAVIIGAMLVAPLMTPILAMGLAVVMGDSKLFKLGFQSVFRGVLLAIAVATVLTVIARLIGLEREALLTTQVTERTQPTLFDLTVALAAGAAGAYSVSRRGVAAALPGVAIAAALVPPLSVVGIGIAVRALNTWLPALLLFVTNLTAITLAGALVYLILGFYPQEENRDRQAFLRRSFLLLLVAFLLLAYPLGRRLANAVSSSSDEITRRTLRTNVEENVRSALEGTDLALLEFQWDRESEEERIDLDVVLYARGPIIPSDLACIVRDLVTPQFERKVDVDLTLLLTSEMTEPPGISTRCEAEP